MEILEALGRAYSFDFNADARRALALALVNTSTMALIKRSSAWIIAASLKRAYVSGIAT